MFDFIFSFKIDILFTLNRCMFRRFVCRSSLVKVKIVYKGGRSYCDTMYWLVKSCSKVSRVFLNSQLPVYKSDVTNEGH